MNFKFFVLFFAGILIMPIFSLFLLSFSSTENGVFEWYIAILKDTQFKDSFLNSLIISAIVSSLAIVFSGFISLSYFESRKKNVLMLLVVIIGLMPADIIAISINKMSQLFGVRRSNYLFLVYSLLLHCLPFSIIILWIRYYFIDLSLIKAARDIGMNNSSLILKIIFPLSKSALVNVFLFSFLLTFNEFTRTYYLSGSTEYLSEYLNGKLSSGTDNSIYAGATITIIITVLAISMYSFFYYFKNSHSSQKER